MNNDEMKKGGNISIISYKPFLATGFLMISEGIERDQLNEMV